MKKNYIYLKVAFFWKKKSPTRHKKNKVTRFAPSNKSITPYSLLQPTWNDLKDGLNLRLRVNSEKYIAR